MWNSLNIPLEPDVKCLLQAENSILAARILELEAVVSKPKRELKSMKDAETSTDLSLETLDDEPVLLATLGQNSAEELTREAAERDEQVAADEVCGKRCLALEEVCQLVKAELASVISQHNAWVLGFDSEKPRKSAIATAAEDAERRKRLTGFSNGAKTPRRSMGDSVLTHTLFNSSVPFATPVQWHRPLSRSSFVSLSRLPLPSAHPSCSSGADAVQGSQAGDALKSLTPGTPDIDAHDWQLAIRQVCAIVAQPSLSRANTRIDWLLISACNVVYS